MSDSDELRWVTVLTLGGVGLALVLALIGNLPFDLPMPTHAVGWVTPTCGLTRGSTELVRGHLARAWQFNPASLLVVAFAAFGLGRALWARVSGQWLTLRVRPGRIGWALVLLAVVGLWANQQAHADFVIHARV